MVLHGVRRSSKYKEFQITKMANPLKFQNSTQTSSNRNTPPKRFNLAMVLTTLFNAKNIQLI